MCAAAPPARRPPARSLTRLARTQAVRSCIAETTQTSRASASPFGTNEPWYHVICWGVPIITMIVAVVADRFSQTMDSPDDQHLSYTCGINESMWAVAYTTPLWGALAYNIYSYLVVHVQIRRAVGAGSSHLSPDAQAELSRRTRLWPRFALYILTFLASQGPTGVRIILQLILQPPLACIDAASSPAWLWLCRFSTVLCPLHGALNGLVYGLTNRRLYQRWSCRRCCRSSAEIEDGRSPLVAFAADAPPPTPNRL